MCSSVVIGTRYAMKGSRIESPLGRVFRTHPDRPCGPPSLLYNGSRFIFGVKSGRGVVFTTHPCPYTEVKETVQLYLYSPSVPAWNVRGWTKVRWLENKNELDATYYFIVLLIGSTCFGHYYAHHQELATVMLITTLVVAFLVCCRLEVRCG